MNKKAGRNILFALLGLALLLLGLLLANTWAADGIMKTLPFVLVGIGAGIFGGNLASAIQGRLASRNLDLEREIRIEEKDERNIVIDNGAKAKAFDVFLMVFGAVVLAFALMQMELYVVLALVAVYLFVVAAQWYYLAKLSKEM